MKCMQLEMRGLCTGFHSDYSCKLDFLIIFTSINIPIISNLSDSFTVIASVGTYLFFSLRITGFDSLKNFLACFKLNSGNVEFCDMGFKYGNNALNSNGNICWVYNACWIFTPADTWKLVFVVSMIVLPCWLYCHLLICLNK